MEGCHLSAIFWDMVIYFVRMRGNFASDWVVKRIQLLLFTMLTKETKRKIVPHRYASVTVLYVVWTN